jgi:hypothetical protein
VAGLLAMKQSDQGFFVAVLVVWSQAVGSAAGVSKGLRRDGVRDWNLGCDCLHFRHYVLPLLVACFEVRSSTSSCSRLLLRT